MANIHVSKSDIVGNQLDSWTSLLQCQICMGMVVEPWECSKCQRLYCEREIKAQSEERCPQCNVASWKKGRDIHLAYRLVIYDLRFACRDGLCNHEPMNYGEYIRHLQQKRSPPAFERVIGPATKAEGLATQYTNQGRVNPHHERASSREAQRPSYSGATSLSKSEPKNSRVLFRGRNGTIDNQSPQKQQVIAPQIVPPAVPQPIIPFVAHSVSQTLHSVSRNLLYQPIKTSMFFQYYKSSNQFTVTFSYQANLLINFNCAHNRWSFNISPFESVDLSAKLYSNRQTKQTAVIQQSLIANHVPKVRWSVEAAETNSQTFVRENLSDDMEKQFQMYCQYPYPANRFVTYEHGKFQYQADLQNLIQINLSTNKQRRLGRIMI